MYQSTLLHAAARHGHVQLAAALLQLGADANALDYGGMRRTPLHWACRGGHVQLVELLVAAGADTKVRGVHAALNCAWGSLGLGAGEKIAHNPAWVVLASACAGCMAATERRCPL